MRIIVDADACPRDALVCCLQLAEEFHMEVITVASFNHVVESPCHITVGDNAQEVDLKVANLARKGDLVVTQDIGLAALILSKGAKAVNTVGREYTTDRMPLMLEERDMKARFRRGGGRTKGPRKRTRADELAFCEGLRGMLVGRANKKQET
jgi:uncharacterized protein YaiI (UPF0178 family)